jgi:hypothetical protein
VTVPLPFDPTEFPDSFVSGLIPAYGYGVVVYPVKVFEDPATRERVFLNAEGREIAVVPPPPGYDPNWVALNLYPDLYSGGCCSDQIMRSV